MRVTITPLNLGKHAVAALEHRFGREVTPETARAFFELAVENALESVIADFEEWQEDEKDKSP